MKEVCNTQDWGREKESEIVPPRTNGRETAPVTLFRNAFKMKIKSGCKAEYKRRHDEIWPELTDVLKKSGISDYSIFLEDRKSVV